VTKVIFDKNAAGPPFTTGQAGSVAFGPYFAGDVVDLAAGSITKLKDAVHTHPNQAAPVTKHTSDY
jgi:hypothetical protein